MSKYDRICACCKKQFYITHSAKDYLYKIGSYGAYVYYCRYTCYRQGVAAEESSGRVRYADLIKKRKKRRAKV